MLKLLTLGLNRFDSLRDFELSFRPSQVGERQKVNSQLESKFLEGLP